MLSTSDDAGFSSLNRKSNFIENKKPQNVLAIEQLLTFESGKVGVVRFVWGFLGGMSWILIEKKLKLRILIFKC